MEYDETARSTAKTALSAHDVIEGLMTLRNREFMRFRLNRLERKIANGLLDGETSLRIAQDLFLSVASVKYHIRNIYKKAGCENKAEFCRIMRSGMDAAALRVCPTPTARVSRA